MEKVYKLDFESKKYYFHQFICSAFVRWVVVSHGDPKELLTPKPTEKYNATVTVSSISNVSVNNSHDVKSNEFNV